MRQILEGSRAIALTVKNIKPSVISAYPITPQTHIVEDLAQFKANGEADYEYVRAESEFAAASIVEGASATGVRVYTATSAQGLLLMNEVVYNIAGMRLPVVLTCANRGVSAPITIWNDQQDAMSVRDAGWIMFFAENAEEAVLQHLLAFKVAEQLRLPAMINVDGYVLTHTYEPVTIPTVKQIKKFLPDYKPALGEYLDPRKPITLGAFAAPAYYMEIRQDLHDDLKNSAETINVEYRNLQNILEPEGAKHHHPHSDGLIEYYGPPNPKTVLIGMGSVVGTIKDAIDDMNCKKFNFLNSVGVIKIRTFRPFPEKELGKLLQNAKYVAVLDKAISLGQTGPLALEIKALLSNTGKTVRSFIIGLGGRDVTKDLIKKIAMEIRTAGHKDPFFMGKIT